jgi:hypothetical protein
VRAPWAIWRIYTNREHLQVFRERIRLTPMIDPVQELRNRLGERPLRVLAREFDISAGYLSDILRGKKPPSERVLTCLGLRIEYVRMGNGRRK